MSHRQTRSPAVAEEPRKSAQLKSGTIDRRISIRGQIVAKKFCAAESRSCQSSKFDDFSGV